MRNEYLAIAMGAFAALIFGVVAGSALAAQPFGGDEDTAFASDVWQAMQGYEQWRLKSGYYPGTSPHGQFLRVYYNLITVQGKPYHVIVKDNYGGQDASQDKVAAKPHEFLKSVTIMLQREAGYDPDNNDWFWAKYAPDGTVEKNPKGMALAGRVAKGTDQGCIACHQHAGGGDYVFTNDQK